MFNLERGKYRAFSMPVQLNQAVVIKILHTILRINCFSSLTSLNNRDTTGLA